MQKGDIVFAKVKDSGKLWPGKLKQLGVMAEVKFFRVKTPQIFPAHEVQPYSPKLAQEAQAANPEKILTLAIKMAEKEVQAQELAAAKNKVLDVDAETEEGMLLVEPNLSKPNISMLPIKEEEDNCKQEEDEERDKAALPSFSSFLEFLMAQPIDALISDSKRKSLKQYTYLSSQTHQPISTSHYPKYIMMCILQQLLLLSCSEKNIKQRSLYQKKAMRVLSSGAVGIQECLNTRVMMWTEYCLKGLRCRENHPSDQQFGSMVANFRSTMQQSFEEMLDDYTEVSNISKTLTNMFQILKK